jgi:hypothetical protein
MAPGAITARVAIAKANEIMIRLMFLLLVIPCNKRAQAARPQP